MRLLNSAFTITNKGGTGAPLKVACILIFLSRFVPKVTSEIKTIFP